ncbi:MAG TPA: hypothetical protein VIJ94_04035 [Caulobacteraceae bacterium]
MDPRTPRPLLLALALALAASGPAAAKAARPAPRRGRAAACDRACLDSMVDRYIDAMIARTPGALPWANRVRYSENNVSMMIGDGLWATITSRTTTPLRAADPASGQAVWMGEIADHGQPGFMALRLEIEGGKIAEAEAVLRRKGGPPQYGDPDAYAHDPAFAASAKVAKPLAAKALIGIVDGWFDAVQGRRGAAPRIAPGCERQDNGVATSSGPTAEGGVQGCAAQIRAGLFKPIERVRARRYPVVDTARGVVVASGFFDLPGAEPKPDPARGLPWAADYPFSVAFISAFKIDKGGVWRVDTISNAEPYLMPSPWGGTK